jgi:hypothetical protein
VVSPGLLKSVPITRRADYAVEDVPVFLLALVNKGQRADISQADRNAIREILGTLADEYREGVRRQLRQTRTRRNT